MSHAELCVLVQQQAERIKDLEEVAQSLKAEVKDMKFKINRWILASSGGRDPFNFDHPEGEEILNDSPDLDDPNQWPWPYLLTDQPSEPVPKKPRKGD